MAQVWNNGTKPAIFASAFQRDCSRDATCGVSTGNNPVIDRLAKVLLIITVQCVETHYNTSLVKTPHEASLKKIKKHLEDKKNSLPLQPLQTKGFEEAKKRDTIFENIG